MIVIKKDNEKFNFRVAALIFNESGSKVLIHRKDNQDFWVLPGGRVEMGEDSKKALVREIKEELNINIDVAIKYIFENFFKLADEVYHELCFYYKTNINIEKHNLNFDDEFIGAEGDEYLYKWIDIKDIDNIDFRPQFLKDKLTNINDNLEHVILYEK